MKKVSVKNEISHNTQLHSQARRENERAWQLPNIMRFPEIKFNNLR